MGSGDCGLVKYKNIYRWAGRENTLRSRVGAGLQLLPDYSELCPGRNGLRTVSFIFPKKQET